MHNRRTVKRRKVISMSVYKNKNNMKNKLQENNNKNDICLAKFVIKNIIK